MNKRSTYAFYGSLRRGMENHRFFERGLRFLYQEAIQGYQLYALDDYPYAVRTGDPLDLLIVEVFQITDPAVERGIHDLELEVGYRYEEITIRHQKVGIYLFEKAGTEPLVKDGDWIKFFRS